MANSAYAAIALTGGTAGALDDIHHNGLADGDWAIVQIETTRVTYFYVYDASSASAESSPGVINPDSNSGNGRWILSNIYIADFTNATHDHADAAGGGNTLTIPTITDFTNANHDHSSASEGGNIGNATCGNLTTGSITSTANTISMGANTDIEAILGRAKIGYDGATSDAAAFAHYDNMSGASYALAQTAAGQTAINAASGQAIHFAINGASQGNWDSAGLSITSGILDVRPNTDTAHEIGRGKLGYNGTDSDTFAIAHYDHMSSSDYAILQNAAGLTVVNASSGQYVALAVNDSVICAVTASAFQIQSPGVLEARKDADATHYLGRALVGYDGTNSDNATFTHHDLGSGTGFRVAAAGSIAIGFPAGQACVVSSASGEELRIEAAGVKFNATGAYVNSGVLDEDDMASDSATALATQQSIKKYVDDQIAVGGHFGVADMVRGGFEWKDADEIYLYGATYMVKDYSVSWTSTLTKAFSGMDGSSWYYIYLDYSGLSDGATVTATEVIYSTTAPTWNTTYNQWMNGDDRCIFAVLSDGAASTKEFFNDGGNYICWARAVEDLTSTDIDQSWTDVTLTMPGISTKAVAGMVVEYVDSPDVNGLWRTNGQTATGGHLMGVAGSTNDNDTGITIVATDSSQIIEVSMNQTGNDTLRVFCHGWFLPRGM